MTDWQPIETAPKDGTDIILWLGPIWERCTMAHWYGKWGVWSERHEYGDDDGEITGIGELVPTHWQPLPEPPEATS